MDGQDAGCSVVRALNESVVLPCLQEGYFCVTVCELIGRQQDGCEAGERSPADGCEAVDRVRRSDDRS